jgi:hypothetical protein
MSTRAADPSFRAQAIALRRAGKSVREIKEALGPVGNRTLSAALKDTPPADWTRRPNAKDDLRERGLTVTARRSAELYRKIEGWAAAAMTGE